MYIIYQAREFECQSLACRLCEKTNGISVVHLLVNILPLCAKSRQL